MECKYKVILASKSPRRAEILRMIGIDFKVIPSNVKEKIDGRITKNKIAEFLSQKKPKRYLQNIPII